MTFQLEEGLCYALGRTYDDQYEASDGHVVANKLDSCQTPEELEDETEAEARTLQALPRISPELEDETELEEKTVQVLPETSPELQSCFTELVFGRSPGSTLGKTWEKSADDCMARCKVLDPCLAMTFQLEEGLCYALGRTYDDQYEASDGHVVANKLDSCQTPEELEDDTEAEARTMQALPRMSPELLDETELEEKTVEDQDSASESDGHGSNASKRFLQAISDFIVKACLLPFQMLWS